MEDIAQTNGGHIDGATADSLRLTPPARPSKKKELDSLLPDVDGVEASPEFHDRLKTLRRLYPIGDPTLLGEAIRPIERGRPACLEIGAQATTPRA